MSSLWLTLALGGTFLAVMLAGIVVEMSMRDRRRPVALLQSQVGLAEPVDLRQQELSGSIIERAVMPAARRVGRTIVSVTPFDMHARINEMLVLAGNPPRLDAERVVAMKIVGGALGFFGGVALATLLPIAGLVKILFVVVFTAVGYVAPSAQLSGRAKARQKMIQRQLSDVMDLLTISVEAGLGFDAAMAQVVRNVPGALAEELTRLLQEVQIGVSRADAFRHLSERTNVPELQAFVLSMVQADMFGVSIASVLRAQSRELRQKRRQRAEEAAQKVPVKLLFPMIFLVMPAMFIVLLGPGAIKIYDQFFG